MTTGGFFLGNSQAFRVEIRAIRMGNIILIYILIMIVTIIQLCVDMGVTAIQ